MDDESGVRLDGRRICLRDWRLSDLEPWMAWFVPGARWKDLDGPYYPLPSSEERAAMTRRKREEIEAHTLPTPRSSLVIADRQTDSFLGLVTWSWESAETYWPVVGIVLFDPETWGHGRGFEGLGLWSEYLFETLPRVVRLDLRTWSGNRGMIRLAEKLGYKEEARFRMARVVNGVHYDGLGYGALRAEWEARYPHGFARHLRDLDKRRT